jgi:hypothetical protein
MLLELPAERGEYIGMLRDISGWPRAGLRRRIPTEEEIAALEALSMRPRAVALLDDDAAIGLAAERFPLLFVLDPLWDAGDLLYGAWHDPVVRHEHAEYLARYGSSMVRIAPLLESGQAVLAPFHLPGSWDPRPGWRRLRPDADEHTRFAWRLRQALILLYWADRLDAAVCASPSGEMETLMKEGGGLPEPALLLRRALDGRDLDAEPSLPRTPLRRQPLCLFVS